MKFCKSFVLLAYTLTTFVVATPTDGNTDRVPGYHNNHNNDRPGGKYGSHPGGYHLVPRDIARQRAGYGHHKPHHEHPDNGKYPRAAEGARCKRSNRYNDYPQADYNKHGSDDPHSHYDHEGQGGHHH